MKAGNGGGAGRVAGGIGLGKLLGRVAAHHKAVVAQFHGLQRHALERDAEIDINEPAFRQGTENHNEGGRRDAPVLAVDIEVTEPPVCCRVILFPDNAEAQGLPVHRGGNAGIHLDNCPEMFNADLGIGTETPGTAVPDKQSIQGRASTLPGVACCTGPEHFLVTFFQIIVCHDYSAGRKPFWRRTSAIWTALVAAPLRILSETHQKLSPDLTEKSLRRRPTNTSSCPSA